MWAGLFPEMAAKIEAGGCYVEFGCGIGGALLSTLLLYPNATAIGFEIKRAGHRGDAAALAAELGVADRLTLRHMDVRDVTEEAAYDTAFWSQGFFPEESRQAALAAIYRAMELGGYLGIPGLRRRRAADAGGAIRPGRARVCPQPSRLTARSGASRRRPPTNCARWSSRRGSSASA